MDKLRKLLFAWTAVNYSGDYPPFLNAYQNGSMVALTIRGEAKSGNKPGTCICLTVNFWTFNHIAKGLLEGDRKVNDQTSRPMNPDC